jgi:hypothetical protein
VPYDFAPQVDLDAALEPTRAAAHRDDAAAHIPAEG